MTSNPACKLMAGAILFLTLGFAPSLHAAPLNWDQCVKEAADNNPDLKISAASLQQARYGKSSATGKFLPQLSAGASHSRSGDEGSLGGILHDHGRLVHARQCHTGRRVQHLR